ncbi:MAG: hypothetical protein WDW36_006734 [Sanguina aurantia]
MASITRKAWLGRTDYSKNPLVEAVFTALVQQHEPTPRDVEARAALLTSFNQVLSRIFPSPSTVTAIAFGSFVSSTYSPTSDIDLALDGEIIGAQLLQLEPVSGEGGGKLTPCDVDPLQMIPMEWLESPHKEMVLSAVRDYLEGEGTARGPVECILTAKVPIIKFLHDASGLDVDLCITSRGCVFKGDVVRELVGVEKRLAGLVRLVKVWAKAHGLNAPSNGTFNSWSLTLMALFALQTTQPALLPPLKSLLEASDTHRPLRDERCSLRECMATCHGRLLTGRATGLLPDQVPDASFSNVELFSWFLNLMCAFVNAWNNGGAPGRASRVSTWFGKESHMEFSKKYLMAVEDPFDNTENTARSIGVTSRHQHTSAYIEHVCRRSNNLMMDLHDESGTMPALLWIFGPVALAGVSDHILHQVRFTAPQHTLMASCVLAPEEAREQMWKSLLVQCGTGFEGLSLADWNDTRKLRKSLSRQQVALQQEAEARSRREQANKIRIQQEQEQRQRQLRVRDTQQRELQSLERLQHEGLERARMGILAHQFTTRMVGMLPSNAVPGGVPTPGGQPGSVPPGLSPALGRARTLQEPYTDEVVAAMSGLQSNGFMDPRSVNPANGAMDMHAHTPPSPPLPHNSHSKQHPAINQQQHRTLLQQSPPERQLW